MEVNAHLADVPASGADAHCLVRVAVDAPLWDGLDYRSPQPLPPGTLVRVPLGRQQVLGVVLQTWPPDTPPPPRLRDLIEVLDAVPALGADWLQLTAFAAAYYQRPQGELMAAALPGWLRASKAAAVQRRAGGGGRRRKAEPATPAPESAPPALLPGQQQVLAQVEAEPGFTPFLLFGVTGSGKTEVYLRLAADALARDPQAQVLVLTPEINLTPQLLARFAARFPDQRLALLHSGLAEAERFDHWLAAHRGQARIVLGTRLAALASLPHLALVLVDEEHDPSYKQQEGARYSARDLAVWRARQRGVAVVLGSATPSLESWRAAAAGRYRLLRLEQRASGALPAVRLLHAGQDPQLRAGGLLGSALQQAIDAQLRAGGQTLLFINRRGYAPVLRCPDCGWLSDCPHCDAHLVFHSTDRSLRCHHCGWRSRVPRACPDCGGLDLQPLGRGTQRVEQELAALFPQARIARIDADTAARRGQAEAGFAAVHAGDVDILVGTQMITKGHDFQRVALVAALNPDCGLFSHDPRAPERLFAQLMQVAGRAGRGDTGAQVLVQTAYPDHPLYQALLAHDYPRFAAQELQERERAGMPPFSHQALLRAEHARLDTLQTFLEQAVALGREVGADAAGVTLYPPVPASLARLAGVQRQQLLAESAHRGALHAFLRAWRERLQLARTSVRWAIDVDPTEF